MGSKSDVEAKKAFKLRLEKLGYQNVAITRSPADIRAERDNQEFFFEIKWTSQQVSYFGAATITEWEAALSSPSNFRFVIARKLGDEWDFRELKPEEFLAYSSIPPFKIFFNIPLIDKPISKKGKRREPAIIATQENLKHLIEFRQKLKEIQKKTNSL